MTLASDALAIARSATRAADPGRGVRRAVSVRAGRVLLQGEDWAAARPAAVDLVALGKAAGAMTDAARRALGTAAGRSIAVVPWGYPAPARPARLVRGDHPLPGRASERAGAALLRFVRSTPASSALLFLVSGGGSAAAEVPAPPLTGADLAATTRLLLARGVPIGGTNVIRRHLSSLKGGGLAHAAGDRSYATLALSDVAGDAPWDIAGGPTVADPTTFRDALAVVRRFRLGPSLPRPVLRYLQDGRSGRRPETRKPTRAGAPISHFHLIGSNALVRDAAAREARRRGYPATVVEGWIGGASRPAGVALARKLVERARSSAGASALISGGETTVRVGRSPGRGGRSLELALAAAACLRGWEGVLLLALGTDGADGRSGVAGGWVDGSTFRRAAELRLDVARALQRHDTAPVFRKLGALVRTGPTGTNVADLQVGLVAARPTWRQRRRG